MYKRKAFLLSIIIGIFLILSASVIAMEYSEAPEIANKVEKGELPPINERLPDEPMIQEVEEIGVYGGELRNASMPPPWGPDAWINDGFLNFKRGTTTPISNIVKEMEISEDAREYTFYLREGHKWSDGEPFTADDVLFWWEDIINNEELTPAFPGWLSSGGPAEFTKIDETTFKFTFPEPNGLFTKYLGLHVSITRLMPKHYLKQFHPRYADKEKLKEMVEEGGFDAWHQLFQDRGGSRAFANNPDLPTLSAWKVETTWPKESLKFERNPYYHKVDPEGQQLPYIDKIVVDLISNAEMAAMKALDGQIDFQYRHMNFGDYTMFKESEDEGGYRVLDWAAGGGWIGLYINQNIQDDPEKRELFQNRDFRYALSYAIDREKINELSMFGVGEIYHPPNKLDDYYVEGGGKTAIEYDPEKANQLLDKIGLDQRDSEGYRTLPSGEPLRITIDTFEYEAGSAAIEFYTQVEEYWDDIGIKTRAREIARELWQERVNASQVDIPGYGIAGINWDIDPLWYVPSSQYTYWAGQWGLWNATNGRDGEEPPAEIKDLIDTYDEMAATVDEEKRIELGQKITQAHNKNLWYIGIVKPPYQPVIANTRLRNILEDGIMDNRMRHEGQARFEQFFFEGGKRK